MNIINVGYRSTNYYVLQLPVGLLLVDCGWPGTLPQFLAEFRRKDLSPSDVKYVLATHFHPDHAGLVEEFKSMGARLILMESQIGALESPPSPTGSKMPALIHVAPQNNIRLSFADSREFLDSIGVTGEIIPTPGHSDDSVSLILEDGSAFTGDLPPRFLIPEDDAVLNASWADLGRHGAKLVYPAHGSYPSPAA